MPNMPEQSDTACATATRTASADAGSNKVFPMRSMPESIEQRAQAGFDRLLVLRKAVSLRMTMNEVELNKVICTVIDAKLAASEFRGLKVSASQNEPWTYDICHSIDHRCDRHNVPLGELLVQVSDTILELEAFHGEGGERVFDIPLSIEIVEPAQAR